MADFIKTFHNFARAHDLTPDSIQDEAAAILNDALVFLAQPIKKSWFKKSKSPKGVYLWGGVGRGKTMIMDLFYDAVPFEQKRRVHFNVFMMNVHSTIKTLREGGQGANPLQNIAKDIASNVRVLCFDEFQIYDIADAMVLSELFKSLFDNGVMVIATSNVAPDDFYKDGLQRARFLPFIPIVKNHMTVFRLDNETDYRQQALRENGVYFIQNESAMRAVFDKITAPHTLMPMVVKVKKRGLGIALSAPDIAWVEFSELCEKPRGTADYQALSSNFQTIFINNIPRMGYDRRNEAKRFIILIDTLYDAGKRVVINAEVEPQSIYQGHDHDFEFDRTISRLLEMRGEEYLSKYKV